MTPLGKLPFDNTTIVISSISKDFCIFTDIINDRVYKAALTKQIKDRGTGVKIDIKKAPSKRFKGNMTVVLASAQSNSRAVIPSKKDIPTGASLGLNELQSKFYDEAAFSDKGLFMLLGSAGTGKSYTVSKIISSSPSVLVTATTHAAKEVLGKMTKQTTKTTQSLLGFRIMKEGYRQVLKQNPKHKHTKADILIVEEISMLAPDIYDAIIKNYDEGLYNKVIFLGDPLQIPSVGESVDIESIPANATTLTVQMRQDDADKELSDFLSNLRHKIENDGDIEKIPDMSAITTYREHKDFCRAYNSCRDNKLIIGYRNNCVDSYNKHLSGGDTHFSVGEEVIVDKPIIHKGFSVVNNGDTVTIDSIIEDSHTYKLSVIPPYGNTKHNITYWKSTSELNKVLDKLKEDEQEEEYWSVSDSSFRLKKLYARTAHKAQGLSVDTVFFDLTDLWTAYATPKNKWNNPISKDLFLRLMFVAITRFKKNAHVFIGTIRDFKQLKPERE